MTIEWQQFSPSLLPLISPVTRNVCFVLQLLCMHALSMDYVYVPYGQSAYYIHVRVYFSQVSMVVFFLLEPLSLQDRSSR